ncbi:MAG: hypothetical protein RR588_08055 [Solibacillus sp.]
MLVRDRNYIIESYNETIKELFIQLHTTTFNNAGEAKKGNLLNRLTELYNKLALTDLMADRSLLAITGLQGTGKTTLIKNLYELPESILPSNSSRGERLPVFFTEKDVQAIETYVYRFSNEENTKVKIDRVKIDEETFNRISMNPVPKTDLWLECIVPHRYLNDEQKSIVLLPGFEKDRKDISQLLLEHILYLSTSSVMVIRKDTYARESTQSMMARVKEIYRSVKPIVAVSFGNVNEEQNEHFKNEIIAEFDVPAGEEERVVITGVGPNFSDSWKYELIDSINEYGYSLQTSDDLEQQLIFSIVAEVDDVLLEIRKLVEDESKSRQLSTESIGNSNQVMYEYEQAYKQVLNALEEEIYEELKMRVDPANERLKEYLESNRSVSKELRTKFFGQKPSELYAFEDKLKEIWEKPEKTKQVYSAKEAKQRTYLSPNVTVLKIVSNYIAREGKDLIDSFDAPAQQAPSNEKLSPFELQFKKQQELQFTEKKEQPLDRINKYFDKNNQSYFALKYVDFKTLSIMGTMFVRESYIENSPEKDRALMLDKSLLQTEIHDLKIMNGVEKMAETTPKILKAIPVILGTDALIDGELDLVTNAATALSSIGLKVTAGQLMGAIGIGIAGAYAAKVLQESIKRANERQLQLAQAGARVFNELPRSQAKAFVHSLERIYARIGSQLYERHAQLSGNFDKIGELEQITYMLRRISQLTNDIKRSKHEQTLFLSI